MEIDKTTKLSRLNIVFEDSEKLFEKFRKQAEDDGQNTEEGDKNLSITTDGYTNETSEIYLEDGKIFYSGNLSSKDGEVYVCFELPISQVLLFEIIGEAIKKFNKIKTVLEATK